MSAAAPVSPPAPDFHSVPGYVYSPDMPGMPVPVVRRSLAPKEDSDSESSLRRFDDAELMEPVYLPSTAEQQQLWTNRFKQCLAATDHSHTHDGLNWWHMQFPRVIELLIIDYVMSGKHLRTDLHPMHIKPRCDSEDGKMPTTTVGDTGTSPFPFHAGVVKLETGLEPDEYEYRASQPKRVYRPPPPRPPNMVDSKRPVTRYMRLYRDWFEWSSSAQADGVMGRIRYDDVRTVCHCHGFQFTVNYVHSTRWEAYAMHIILPDHIHGKIWTDELQAAIDADRQRSGDRYRAKLEWEKHRSAIQEEEERLHKKKVEEEAVARAAAVKREQQLLQQQKSPTTSGQSQPPTKTDRTMYRYRATIATIVIACIVLLVVYEARRRRFL